jgi:plastocyanin
MRKLLAVCLAIALLGVLSAVAIAATKTVKVGDNYFVKPTGVPTVTVKSGDTVKWKWAGKRVHNVHATKGPVTFSSKIMTKGTFSKKLTKKGSYTIICDVHGAKDQSMKLVVR